MAKLLILLAGVVLFISILLSSFLSLEYPPATYVDIRQRINDLTFDYAHSVVTLFDIVGLYKLPSFYRWFYGDSRIADPEENSFDTKFDNVAVTVFKPPAYSSKKLLPGIIYVPGGSYVLPPKAAHYHFCSMLATNVSAIVFLVHPRLSPEHKFPAALEDVRAVSYYILRNPERLGVRPTRIAIGGDDTGASLAATVAIELVNADPNERSLPPNSFYSIYLISPVLQSANLALPSYKINKVYKRGIPLPRAISYYSGVERPSSSMLSAIDDNRHIPFTMKIRFQPLLDFNLLNETDVPEEYVAPDLALDLSPDVPEDVTWLASNVEAFPLLYEDRYFTKLPVTYIQVCEHSTSRDDGLLFAKRLERSAVSLKLAVIRQALHNDPVVRSSIFAEATRDIVRFMRRTLYKQGA